MSLPISEHPTWLIQDSSKLDTWKTCPRKYFYEYVLGWRSDAPAQDLYFGQCWHIAREHQLIHGYDQVLEAFTKAETEYRKVFPPETDAIYNPKVPAAILQALLNYMNQRPLDLVENEVVEIDGVKMTEISGTVPVDDKRKLHYKMDSIMHNLNGDYYFSWDHKSTTGKWFQDTRWDAEYQLSIQNGTYTHCLYCMFPIEKVRGVEFCKVGFEYLMRASKNRSAGYHAGIRHVPAFKEPDQMNVWLWNVLDYLNDIERDFDRLSHCKEGDPVLMAFQLNPKSCTAYKGCPYHEYCMAWANPLQRCQYPPIGYHTEFWDPSQIQTTVKKDLEFTR